MTAVERAAVRIAAEPFAHGLDELAGYVRPLLVNLPQIAEAMDRVAGTQDFVDDIRALHSALVATMNAAAAASASSRKLLA